MKKNFLPTNFSLELLHARIPLAAFAKPLSSVLLLFFSLYVHGQPTWNFETADLRGWTKTGTAFNTQPTFGNNVSVRRPGLLINIQGNYWIGTYENRPGSSGIGTTQGDAPTGVLTSNPFPLTVGNISFLVGGGNDINRLRVELLIKLNPGETPPPVILGIGERVTMADGEYYIGIFATGRNDEVMRRETFVLERRFERRTARIRIVDNSSQAWGHINVDDFQFSADPPGDVWIKGMEITQAIQNYSESGGPLSRNAVPLIARKPTVLRIYVQSRTDSRGPWNNVRARVTIRGISGEAVRDRFIWTSAITIPTDGSHRERLDDNINFALEYDQTVTGEREIEVRLEPLSDRIEYDLANNTQTLRVNFQANPGFGFYGLRYKYTSAPDIEAAPFAELEPYRAWAEKALPIAGLHLLHYPGDPIGEIGHRWVRNPMGMLVDEGYIDARTWSQGLIDRLFPRGGQWVADLQPERTTNYQGAHYVDGAGNHVINLSRHITDPGPVLGHELGHGLGQPHTADNPRFPHADRRIGPQIGLKTGVYPYQLFSQSGNYDLMSDRYPVWVSPFTYTEMLSYMTGGRISVLPEVRNAKISQFNSGFFRLASFHPDDYHQISGIKAEQQYLYVSGRIWSNGKAEFQPFEQIKSEDDISGKSQTKEYVLNFEDGNGKILASQFVDATIATDDKDLFPSKLFSLYTAMITGTKRITLKKENAVLAERIVSGNSPKIAISTPTGELSGKQVISWIGEDADKDALTYSVWYTTNSKQWIPLAINLIKTSYEVNCDNLPGSDRAQFRVLASDGINTTEAHTTAMIRVAFKKPQVVISPMGNFNNPGVPNQIIAVSDANPLMLSGTAYDWEDGQSINLNTLQWRSDRDGELGVGSWIVIRKLSPGKHKITLTATDSDKMQGSDSIQVVVQDNTAASSASGENTNAIILRNENSDLARSNLNIYPNPGTDIVNIVWKDNYKGLLDIRILDASGKTVHSFNVKKEQLNYSDNLSLGFLKLGIYFIEIKAKNGQSILTRFIKN